MLIPVGSKIATQRRRLAELVVARRKSIEFLMVLTVAAGLGAMVIYLLHMTMGSLWTTMPVAVGLGLMALGYMGLVARPAQPGAFNQQRSACYRSLSLVDDNRSRPRVG